MVLLYLHPSAASVALLSTPKFSIDQTCVNSEPGRDALDDRYESFAVRFASGREPERHMKVLPQKKTGAEVTDRILRHQQLTFFHDARKLSSQCCR